MPVPKAGPLSPTFDKYEPPGAYARQSLRNLLAALAARQIEPGWHYFHVVIGDPVEPVGTVDGVIGQLSSTTSLTVNILLSASPATYDGFVINLDDTQWVWISPGYFAVIDGEVTLTLTIPADLAPTTVGVALAVGEAAPTSVGSFTTVDIGT